MINHLQDCGKDYRAIDRVYVPLDALAAAGVGVEAWARRPPRRRLLAVIRALAGATQDLLDTAPPFAGQIRDCAPGPGGRRDPAPGREPRPRG